MAGCENERGDHRRDTYKNTKNFQHWGGNACYGLYALSYGFKSEFSWYLHSKMERLWNTRKTGFAQGVLNEIPPDPEKKPTIVKFLKYSNNELLYIINVNIVHYLQNISDDFNVGQKECPKIKPSEIFKLRKVWASEIFTV